MVHRRVLTGKGVHQRPESEVGACAFARLVWEEVAVAVYLAQAVGYAGDDLRLHGVDDAFGAVGVCGLVQRPGV